MNTVDRALAELAGLRLVVPAADWSAALCAQSDPEAWFPEGRGSARSAKRVCARCPIRRPCLAWALTTNQRHGIWGGTTPAERRTLRRQRTTTATAARSGRVAAAPAARQPSREDR